jgi:hypothetical protein
MNRFDILVPRRFVPAILLIGSFLIVSGCQSKGPKNIVEGKVSLKGGSVEGMVTFIGPDNKKASSPIGPDGKYQIAEPSLGENKITVESMGGALAAGGTKADMNPNLKGNKQVAGGGTGPKGGATMGNPPPPKYKDPDKSGLKFTVKGGKEKYDIDLTP